MEKLCPCCNELIEEWWNYCPMCGYHIAYNDPLYDTLEEKLLNFLIGVLVGGCLGFINTALFFAPCEPVKEAPRYGG